MSRSLRHGVLAAAFVLAAAPLTACAAGNDAPTLQVRPDNAYTTVEDIEVQSAVVIVGEGEKALATVSATVVNNGKQDQTLQSVTLDGKTFELAGPEGKEGAITVPAGGSVLLGGEGNPSATLADFSSVGDVQPGDFAKVTFQLSRTGAVSLQANVVPGSGYYKSFGPTPQATPSPSEPAPTATPTTEASPGATAQVEDENADASASPAEN